jgi:hypothetical protein
LIILELFIEKRDWDYERDVEKEERYRDDEEENPSSIF